MVAVGYKWLDILMVESWNCQANSLVVVVGYRWLDSLMVES